MPADARGDPWRGGASALVFSFYVLLLLEGPLRKWMLPGVSNALVFIRDPVMVLIVIAHFCAGPSSSARRWWSAFGAAVALLGCCTLCQVASTDVPPLALLAGWRNYILFAPLLWIIPDVFTRDDYVLWLKLNLMLAVPVAALVFVQYRSAPSAFVNAAPGGVNDGVFMLVEDVVRPYGLFSFTLGHSAFAAWMLSAALATVVARRSLGISFPVVAVGMIGIVCMGLFSGSRTYLLFAVAVIGTFMAGTLLAGSMRERRLALATLACVIFGAAIATTLDGSLISNILERQSAASQSEGSLGVRVVSVATAFVGEMGQVPVVGYGLGAGTNVANFLANGRTDHVLAEYELTRIVQELGPYFGSAVILSRWSLVAAFCTAAVRALVYRGDAQPFCYLGFVAPLFLVHDVSLQNTMIGIGWFAAGLFNCVVKLAMADAIEVEDSEAPAVGGLHAVPA